MNENQLVAFRMWAFKMWLKFREDKFYADRNACNDPKEYEWYDGYCKALRDSVDAIEDCIREVS